MLTVKLEYGIGNRGAVESSVTFENYEEACEFAHKALDEILEEVRSGDRADNGLIRIWDDESDEDLIDDLGNGEY
ncbi:MAG: hypothetical protein HXK43_05400 [Atopobium sp.]|nr:hypothetical protein [Atopobium sp.]